MRTGVIAKKVGMTQKWRENGNNIAVTMLYLDNVTVTAVRNEDEQNKNGQKGYNAVQLGAGDVKDKHLSKPLRQAFAKKDIKPRRKLKEFRVSKDCLLEVGDVISAKHFVVGQKVDITGISQGKGFAGAMKRHNFHGLRASHGVSVSHRSHGSTGQCQDPGKVFKGKKMAGHMGAKQVTGQNLEIIETDEEKGIILVKGNVPGPKGGWVSIVDAVKQPLHKDAVLPAKLVEKNEKSEDAQSKDVAMPPSQDEALGNQAEA